MTEETTGLLSVADHFTELVDKYGAIWINRGQSTPWWINDDDDDWSLVLQLFGGGIKLDAIRDDPLSFDQALTDAKTCINCNAKRRLTKNDMIIFEDCPLPKDSRQWHLDVFKFGLRTNQLFELRKVRCNDPQKRQLDLARRLGQTENHGGITGVDVTGKEARPWT